MNQDYTVDTNQMPNFNSHEEAREWFKGQLGDRFLLRMTDMKEVYKPKEGRPTWLF